MVQRTLRRAVDVALIHAFVPEGQPAGGSPVGVVLDAEDLEEAGRQAIASTLGLSATAFHTTCADGAPELRFFSPVRPLSQCGHATVAAVSALAWEERLHPGRTIVQTLDGPREVELTETGRVLVQQTWPVLDRVRAPERTRIARALGQAELASDPLVACTEERLALVELDDRASMGALEPDLAGIRELSEALDLVGVYVFARETIEPGHHASARMFAPRYGIDEEAATGMGAGALGAHLRAHLGLDDVELWIEQGDLMATPSPSRMEVRVPGSRHDLGRVRVGGRARARRMLRIDR